MDHWIIPRSEWGARHPDGFADAPLPAAECWLHHSVTLAPDLVPPWDDDYAAVRLLEQIGQQRFGGGISYTWPITPAGLIFQGHSVHRQGAHTGGRNDRARAICFVGNYDTAKPTTAQLHAAAWLLQHAKAKGWLREARLNGGHRDLKQTACPGQHAYALIGEINRLAAGPPITQEDDVSAEEVWTHRIKDTDGQLYGADVFVRNTRKDVSVIRSAVEKLAPPQALDYDELAKALLRNMASG